MAQIYVSDVSYLLRNDITEVIEDDDDGIQEKSTCWKFVEKRPMTQNYEDDVETAGPLLFSDVAEGTSLPWGDWTQGFFMRYFARKIGMKMGITEEAEDDVKYKKCVELSRHLKSKYWLTVDYELTALLVYAWDTNYIGGDGKPFLSTTHVLPRGGTFSNTLSTPASPSPGALQSMATLIRRMPGHDGLVRSVGLEPKKIVYPAPQWADWRMITGSKMTPRDGNFAEINVVNTDLGLELVTVNLWLNTDTNWMTLTSAKNGLQFRERKKPTARDWVDNENEILMFGMSGRYSKGWTEFRHGFGSQAS